MAHSSRVALAVRALASAMMEYVRSGELLGQGACSCSVSRPLPNWVEQDCTQYWESAVGAIRQALVSIEPSAVVGLACCGHTPSLVLLDGDGRPVRPAIIWQDSRASGEAGTLEQEVGSEQWKEWLGLDLPRNASYPPARLRWLRTARREMGNSGRSCLQLSLRPQPRRSSVAPESPHP